MQGQGIAAGGSASAVGSKQATGDGKCGTCRHCSLSAGGEGMVCMRYPPLPQLLQNAAGALVVQQLRAPVSPHDKCGEWAAEIN